MRKTYLYILGLLILSTSCTKLDEQILDEFSTSSDSPADIAQGTIAPVYAMLPSIFEHTRYFALQEISTDEAILPYRGGTDWGDNGIYMSLHRHETVSTDPNVRNVFNHITLALSRAITAIVTLPQNTDASAALFLTEARGMRAYYNLLMLDLFGIAFLKENLDDRSVILRGQEAVDYIKSELLAVEPLLSSEGGHGRLTKEAVWGLLARLHLQSAVYRDVYAASFDFRQEDMDKVIEYTDKIINSGKFELSTEYFKLFDDDNDTNKEIIFAVDQRANLNGHNRLGYFSLSGDQFPLPQYPGANGTDGPAITSDFYQSWVQAYGGTDPADADPRFFKQNVGMYTNPADSCVPADQFHINRGILRGQQYGLIRNDGVFVRCANGEMKVGPLFNITRSRPDLPVNFTELVDYTTEGSAYNAGYRVSKYEFSRGSVSGRNFGEHNIVILRLADIYLMRAEAKLRKDGNETDALADVNAIRSARTARHTAPPLSAIDLDILLRERGFELYWESIRRTDLIRFGKYESAWGEKTNTDRNKRLFPIPLTAIDGASVVDGYLVQNQGY